jgi:hypothetical protein
MTLQRQPCPFDAAQDKPSQARGDDDFDCPDLIAAIGARMSENSPAADIKSPPPPYSGVCPASRALASSRALRICSVQQPVQPPPPTAEQLPVPVLPSESVA